MWFSKSGWFPDRLRFFSVLALVPVLLPISSRIFRRCYDPFFVCFKRPFAKYLAYLSLLFGVSSRHFFALVLKLDGLALLLRLGVLFKRNLIFLFHRLCSAIQNVNFFIALFEGHSSHWDIYT